MKEIEISEENIQSSHHQPLLKNLICTGSEWKNWIVRLLENTKQITAPHDPVSCLERGEEVGKEMYGFSNKEKEWNEDWYILYSLRWTNMANIVCI
jgi:hypothetical protein